MTSSELRIAALASTVALPGGRMTLIGTSPEIVVARMRAQILGEPFGMLDARPVGETAGKCGVSAGGGWHA